LRFDYDGTGNSAGSDTDPDRVSAWLASIEHAAAELRARSGVQHIALHGVRLGGTLAAAAAERAGADGLILFAATATGRPYVREVLALGRFMRADSDLAVAHPAEDADEQIAGFLMTRQTIADLAALDARSALARVRGRSSYHGMTQARTRRSWSVWHSAASKSSARRCPGTRP